MSDRLHQIRGRMTLPVRPREGHKGTFGKVLIIGGSPAMIGAPAFAALSALRMGCGLAYIAASDEVIRHILCVAPEAVGVPIRGASPRKFAEALEAADAVVVGPGLGASQFALSLLRKAIASEKPLVIDADGLNLIAARKAKLARKPMTAVLTPHPGEMSRLAGLFGEGKTPSDDPGRLRLAASAAVHLKQVIVLKGARTVITDGRDYAINTTGDSTLAKAGSGDILSGMIGTLLGQGLAPVQAATLATYYHGLAGEIAGRRLGQRSALARDVIDAIPEACKPGKRR